MTKIMIDDVDITECEHKTKVYKDYKCEIHNLEQCSNFPNCYYKQLKRKEEELITANCIVLTYNMQNGQLCEQLDQLEAELKEFKDMAKQGLDNYKDVGGCWGCGISFSFDELLKSYKKLEKSYFEATKESPTATRINAKFNKYEQALQQIKEFAENEMEQNVDTNIILQKCEVIND